MVPRGGHRGIVLLPHLHKVPECLPARLAMTRLRIDPKEIFLKPFLLLFGCPSEVQSAPLTLEVRIHVPVTRANTIVLLLNTRPDSGLVMNRQSFEEKMLWHLPGVRISENVHGVTFWQNSSAHRPPPGTRTGIESSHRRVGMIELAMGRRRFGWSDLFGMMIRTQLHSIVQKRPGLSGRRLSVSSGG
jgi:hypothetical protein